MTPAQSADLAGALDSATKAIADKFHSRAEVRARLEFLLWRVMNGRCSDFFKVTGRTGDGEFVYDSSPVRTITRTFTNPFTDQPDEYSLDVYSTSPQWANPRRMKDAQGELLYVHCRYKGDRP